MTVSFLTAVEIWVTLMNFFINELSENVTKDVALDQTTYGPIQSAYWGSGPHLSGPILPWCVETHCFGPWAQVSPSRPKKVQHAGVAVARGNSAILDTLRHTWSSGGTKRRQARDNALVVQQSGLPTGLGYTPLLHAHRRLNLRLMSLVRRKKEQFGSPNGTCTRGHF